MIAYGLYQVTPRFRPFSLLDLSISFPYTNEVVSSADLVVASVILPGILIVLVTLFFIPGPRAYRKTSRVNLIRVKLWEWNTGWLGLALSLITSLLISLGLKNIVGKPRPDMLARCMPDLNNIAAHIVGGYGEDISSRWVLVDQTICTQSDPDIVKDGFRSWPSGHATSKLSCGLKGAESTKITDTLPASFAGLLYLSLWLCAKFAVAPPHLSFRAFGKDTSPKLPVYIKDKGIAASTHNMSGIMRDTKGPSPLELRFFSAASPPLYLLILAYLPTGVALFISASRYYNYRHYGFDVITGALIGSLTSYFSFRLYNPPISRGPGWSWEPRSPERAFGIGVGTSGFVSYPGASGRTGHDDLEMGDVHTEENGSMGLERAHVEQPQNNAAVGPSPS